MDPITQGLLGGVAAQVTTRKDYFRLATGAGFLAGILPDLDLLIRSSTDPLLSLQYHRYFTHALIFIPVGGFIAGFLYWVLRRRKPPIGITLWAATVGFATHGLLDALTSYGTVLFWPFSQTRVFLDALPIISPLFSLVLLLGLLLTCWQKRRWPALLALLFVFSYISLGWVQRDRALDLQKQIANQRGHEWERGRVIPTLGNILLWRSIYESDGKIFVDGIRVVPGGIAKYWTGGEVPKFVLNEEIIASSPQNLIRDLKRYAWFADDYLGRIPGESLTIGDMRYSVSPTQITPLWGIKIISKGDGTEVQKVRYPRRAWDQVQQFWKMFRGRWPGGKVIDNP